MKPATYTIADDAPVTIGALKNLGITSEPIKVSRGLITRGGASAVMGGLLGIAIALIVNSTLVEISVSPFFALYFGMLFMSVGAVIVWRVNSAPSSSGILTAAGSRGGQSESDGRPTNGAWGSNASSSVSNWLQSMGGTRFDLPPEEIKRRNQLTFFALLICFSGFLCFVLERNWFVGMSSLVKIPVYTVLGVSVCFALMFSVVDFVNYVIGFLQVAAARPIVESQRQIYLVMGTALVMGGIFGFIFGALDIPNHIDYQVRLALLKDEYYTYPIGGLLGAIAGFGNEYLRQTSDEYSALQSTIDSIFDQDI